MLFHAVVKHPCADVVIDERPIPDMITSIQFGPISYTMGPFTYDIEPAGACGLQEFVVGSYTAGLDLTSQLTDITDELRIDLIPTTPLHFENHAIAYFPDWPSRVMVTPAFKVIVLDCRRDSYEELAWSSGTSTDSLPITVSISAGPVEVYFDHGISTYNQIKEGVCEYYSSVWIDIPDVGLQPMNIPQF